MQSSSNHISFLLQDPDIKGTVYESMLNHYIKSKDPKAKFDGIQSYSNPLFKTQQDLNDEISRVYGEQLEKTQKGAQAGSEYQTADYQNTIDQLNQGLAAEQRNLNNKSASQGAFGSTAWQENQKSLANEYNNKFKSAYDASAYKATTQGLENQSALGYNQYNPSFAKTQANIVGNAITPVSTGQSYKYNPFNQAVGGIQANKNYSLNKLNYN